METVVKKIKKNNTKKQIIQKAIERIKMENNVCEHQTFNDHANFNEHNSHSAHVSAPVFSNY